MAKEHLTGAVVDMGLALYLTSPNQARIVAKRWKRRVTASNKRILSTLINMNDLDLFDAVNQAVGDFVNMVESDQLQS